ncbi:MAG: tetratricopeptide repeat protein [Polyangiales bacterium]
MSLALALLAVAGCATTHESRMQKDARLVEKENDPQRLLARGKAFHSVGDFTRAEQYYAAAIQQGAPEKEVLPLLLRVCIQATRYQVAIDYALPVLQKHPDDWRLRLLVASLYTAVGQPARARDHYERVVQQQPDDATARYGLAVLLRDEFHDRVGADKHFREYLRLAPEGPHAEEAKGSLLKDLSEAPVAAPVSSVVPVSPPKKLP